MQQFHAVVGVLGLGIDAAGLLHHVVGLTGGGYRCLNGVGGTGGVDFSQQLSLGGSLPFADEQPFHHAHGGETHGGGLTLLYDAYVVLASATHGGGGDFGLYPYGQLGFAGFVAATDTGQYDYSHCYCIPDS